MTVQFLGVDHVQLAAPEGCETEARSFFAGLLGWKEIEKPEGLRQRGGVWFQCGVHQVHIGVQRDFVPAKKAHPAFQVKNIEQLRKHLIANSVEIVDDEVRADEGVKRFYTQDPFGNRIEFLEWLNN
ncbi:VOC family protein [Paenibacillus xylaniclasticus]|uniref:VOC family protein n=1 Tax=Paenibacillus xylaniclasticus TaxID=588083 RepID=UPI000FDCDACB|nr:MULTISPECIES: VOC family protein [Paenibacillus]GFN31531.1 glyoxalase [Paenibacillus curdlanolyticus]